MKVKSIAKKKARQAEQGNKLKIAPKPKIDSVKSKVIPMHSHFGSSVRTHFRSKFGTHRRGCYSRYFKNSSWLP